MEFEQDSVRMNIGDKLFLITAPAEPEAGTVYAPKTLVHSMVLRCTTVIPSIRVVPRPLPCPTVASMHQGSRPDTAILVDDALMTVIARVLPCARGPDGEPLTPDAWASSGSFGECATWFSTRTEAGPGLEVIHASRVDAVECGSSWVSSTRRPPVPPPFASYARVEVEIAC